MPTSSEAVRWEEAFSELLGDEYAHAGGRDVGVDFASADRGTVIELKAGIVSARDLTAALIHLARYATSSSDVQRAVLVARVPKLTAGRTREEWRGLDAVLRPSIMKKLALVALASDGDVIVPEGDAELQRFAAIARGASGSEKAQARHGWAPWSSKNYEIWKVLLAAWLRSERPLPIQEIARRSGASHPTIASVLDRLERSNELERSSSRAAQLTGLPRASLAEIVVLADQLRSSTKYYDASGRPPDATRLLQRITRKARPNVGVGGVAAARFYMPSFDLHGLPRAQVTVAGRDSLVWLEEIEPALERTPGLGGAPLPLLIVHRLARPEPGFEHDAATKTTYADTAEVLLDLYELRLVDQAEELVRALRARKEAR